MPSFVIYETSTGQVQGKYNISSSADIAAAMSAYTGASQSAIVLEESTPPVNAASLLIVGGVVIQRVPLTLVVSAGTITTSPSFTGTLEAHTADGVVSSLAVTSGTATVPTGVIALRVPLTDPSYFSSYVFI